MKPFKDREAEWVLMSLSQAQCRALVDERASQAAFEKRSLLDTCGLRSGKGSR